jgi:diacylglycerol kinase
MTKTSWSCEGIPGMNNDEIEAVRSAAIAIAGAIINSFMVTHSIITTVIVTVSVLAVVLSRG